MNGAEDDLSWTRLTKPWERLRWARRRMFPTQEAFADAIGMGRTGYRKYETDPALSDHTPLTLNQAMPWGKKLRVRGEWLLEGRGLPWLADSDQRRLTPAQERAVRLLDDKPEDQQVRIVEALELLLRTGTGG